LDGKEDFGKPGKVSCSVLSSPDTDSTIEWHFKGKPVPLNEGKYRIENVEKSDDLTEYALIVDDVQEEDMGAYLCRLSSDFHLESETKVWISLKEETIDQCRWCQCCSYNN
jgi:hypothetical protein